MNDRTVSPALDHPAEAASPPTLDHLALLAARGVDVRSFLDSQLTRNVPVLEPERSVSRASIAGYCSPKGRLLASFVVWCELSPSGETIFMLTSRDIVETVAKRLRMYVLRAKVTIEVVTAVHAIEGFHDSPSLPEVARSLDVWSVRRDGDVTWIRHPDADGVKRVMRIGTAASAAPGLPVDAANWRWSEIRAGIPRITATTQDRFVPQMVNLEALGGVDFRKGCFPGQEVVARSQYLGKLKRRMALASTDASWGDGGVIAQPATDIWSAEDSGPAGLVVNAERGPEGRVALLVELPLARFESAGLTVAESSGPALTIESLPYVLPENEVFVRPKL